jgi:hypothetical protein
MNNWYFNGYMVQELKENIYNQNTSNYSGVARYISWPLDQFQDKFADEINAIVQKDWSVYYQYVTAIYSMDLLRKYIDICLARQLHIRILKVSTNCDNPLSNEVICGKFLGYDYGFMQSPYSVLYDEIILGYKAKFGHLKMLLNENGLLNNENDLWLYTNTRRNLITDGEHLENPSELYAFRLEEISTTVI